MSSPYDPHPIDHSIAYADVCAWAQGKSWARRPKPEILEKALKHAEFLGDAYIVKKVDEAYDAWESIEDTPTPRDCHPGATPKALELEEQLTNAFKVFRRPSCEVVVFETARKKGRQKTQAYSPLMDDSK